MTDSAAPAPTPGPDTADAPSMHRGQLTIDASTVLALLADQFPQLETGAGERVTRVRASGTVNAIFRIGDAHAARFPLVVADPDASLVALRAEAESAREFASVVSVPSTETLGIGMPGHGYPGPWSVGTWLPGSVATPHGLADSAGFALDVAALLLQLRAAPVGARRFTGGGRGGDLRDHDAWLQECFQRSAGILDVPPLREAWARFRSLPRRDADAMSHKDLIPANLLTTDARLTGVLDAGGFGPADPALDLVVAWHVFDPAARAVLRDALRRPLDSAADERLRWQRGAAWAFVQAMGLPWYYRDSNPAMAQLGLSTLERIADSGIAQGSS